MDSAQPLEIREFFGVLSHRPVGEALESLEIGLVFDNHRPEGATGYPIEAQGSQKVYLHPDGGPDGADETGKAQGPLRDMFEESQQQVGEQPRPDLPLDRLFVAANEVSELERLLEFLEEGLMAQRAR